jgi:hypothetical protein
LGGRMEKHIGCRFRPPHLSDGEHVGVE